MGVGIRAPTRSDGQVQVTYYTDPGCPIAYSASPVLRVLEWRYGDQLSWQLCAVVIAEQPDHYLQWAPDPSALARVEVDILRAYGMPALLHPAPRFIPTTGVCRALVAARSISRSLAWPTLRALQFAWFTSPLLLDDNDAISTAIRDFLGSSAEAVIDRLENEQTLRALEADMRAARSAEGTAAAVQRKTAPDHAGERFTTPTLAFKVGSTAVVAGGLQPVEAYDVLLANIAPWLKRRRPPKDLLELFGAFEGHRLTTQEVAAITADDGRSDRRGAELALTESFARGLIDRRPLGNDALWSRGRT